MDQKKHTVERSSQRKVALVVGDDSAVADAVHKVLPGWEMVRAQQNNSALEMLRAKKYDLVLTGDRTSSKDDVELLHQIRIVRPHTRLIILTSKGTPGDVVAAMRDRAFSYFSQPYSMTDFAQMLQLATTGPVWDEGIEILAATPAWIRLLARCDLRTAERLLQFIHEAADLPPLEKEEVGLAFREVLMNALEHGANFNPTQHVEIAYVRAKRVVLCRVKDPGQGFSLEEARHAAIANPPGDPTGHLVVREDQGLRSGGFGIMLARNVIDEMIYGERGNDILLIKYLNGKNQSEEQKNTSAPSSS